MACETSLRFMKTPQRGTADCFSEASEQGRQTPLPGFRRETG